MDLKWRYTTCRNFKHYGVESNGQPANLVKDISEDPYRALYISKLQFNGWRWYWGGPGAQHIPPEFPGSQSSETQYSRNTLQIISNAIQNCAMVPKDCKNKWIQSVEKGNEDPLIALLLTMLPNLTKLRLQNVGEFYLQDMITRISEQNDSTFLSKLVAVELLPLYGRGIGDLHEEAVMIQNLSLLPSITSISALDYSHHALEDISDLKLMGQNRKSQVFHMSFSICYIDPVILDDLVECTIPLTSVRYRLREHHSGQHDFDDMDLFTIRWTLSSRFMRSS